jgi:hypothetical protein
MSTTTNHCAVCDQANLEDFKCPGVEDACLACCNCPEHVLEGWTTEDTEPYTTCERAFFCDGKCENNFCESRGDGDAEY